MPKRIKRKATKVEPMPMMNMRPRAVDMVKDSIKNSSVPQLSELQKHKRLVTLICADLDARAEVGYKKYKTYLQPFNGRDQLVDAYQEILDCVKYMSCRIYESADCVAEYHQLLAVLASIGAKVHEQ